MKYVYRLLEAKLALQEQLKDKIMDIIKARCTIGTGRVARGALLSYIYYHLGFHGRPGNDFSKYFTQILLEEGFRCSYLSGARCFIGLTWKDEDKKNWRRPVAEDLPKFNGGFFEMPVKEPNGQMLHLQ